MGWTGERLGVIDSPGRDGLRPRTGGSLLPSEEWFGEGTAFDSTGRLAAALLDLAADGPPAPPRPPAEPLPSPLQRVAVALPAAPLRRMQGAPVDVLESFRRLDELLAADDPDTIRRRRVTERLHEVMERGIAAMYQPIVDLASGHIAGVEALARFREGNPRQWFHDASAVGLREPLEIAAIQAALAGLPRLPRDGYISLNISPATLLRRDLGSLLASPSPANVVVEMTEDDLADAYSWLIPALKPLREAGVRVAIDDAGAGPTSLRHLILFHPDIIKLDTSLTRGIDRGPARRALSGALVALARELGATIVAEGIETSAELRALRELGVTHGQGYLVAPPLRPPIDQRAIVAALAEAVAA